MRLKHCNDAGSQVVQQVLLRQSDEQLLQPLQVRLQNVAALHADILQLGDSGGGLTKKLKDSVQALVLGVAARKLRATYFWVTCPRVGLCAGRPDGTGRPLLPFLPALASAHPVDCFVCLESRLRST